ncbi:hypothetical protein DFH07DRAFT_972675 [Mycena maculata]|uniref:RING-type domain-containing protein n=1 Tax=Mycena maculata TaxID=230809 RepID=A0AAD7HHD6_9AGAR|nr:hypothetical protein DFH07DRAFT_972675 [Mycena maculata]
MGRLGGSSIDNPWVLDSHGGLALEIPHRPRHALSDMLAAVANLPAAHSEAPSSCHLDIIYGPPSTILQQPLSVRTSGATSRTTTTTLIRAARNEVTENRRHSTGAANSQRSRARARERAAREQLDPNRTPPRAYFNGTMGPGPWDRPLVRRVCNALPSAVHAGSRTERHLRLTTEDLYLDAAHPLLLAEPRDHHVCSICWAVKSHPVSYKCGHSHCYVCIRVALEQKWECPDCAQVMYEAPFRHYGEEQSIRGDYPQWIDESRVQGDWEGLIFPRRRLIVVEDSP